MDGPVSGFGVAGKDYLRLSAFNRRHDVQKAGEFEANPQATRGATTEEAQAAKQATAAAQATDTGTPG